MAAVGKCTYGIKETRKRMDTGAGRTIRLTHFPFFTRRAPMTQTKPLLSGVLYKRGAGGMIFGRRNWKLRYFELTATKLQYFTSAKRRKLRGELLLVGDDAARFKLEMMPPDQMKHSQTSVVPKWRFVVSTPERELLLAAFSDTEMRTWVHHLGMVFPTRRGLSPLTISTVRGAHDVQRVDMLAGKAAPQVPRNTTAPGVPEDSLLGSFTLDFPDQNHAASNQAHEFTHHSAGEGGVYLHESQRFRGSSITANECGFVYKSSIFEVDESALRRASESSALKTFRCTDRSHQRSSVATGVTL